jgi:hypothetical protein
MKCKRKKCRACGQTAACAAVVRCGGRKGKARNCVCNITPDLVPTCFEPGGCETFTQNCTKNEDCPAGEGCRTSCCNAGECFPLCNIG